MRVLFIEILLRLMFTVTMNDIAFQLQHRS